MEAKSRKNERTVVNGAEPRISTHSHLLQEFGSCVKMPIALKESVCLESTRILNQILADTMTLRDMYKKHHWQVTGTNFYSLHLLFDKHYKEQEELVDDIAERIQLLGGISIAMAKEVAEMTSIPHPPKGREESSVQISRLLKAHEILLKKVRLGASQCAELGDDATNDLLISQVMRRNEMQVWFLAEHLV